MTPSQLEQMLCGVEEPLDVQQLRVRSRVEGFDKAFQDARREPSGLSKDPIYAIYYIQ